MLLLVTILKERKKSTRPESHRSLVADVCARPALYASSLYGWIADFETAQCLLNAEVALILGKKKEEVESAGRDVSLNRVFLESLKYAKRFNAYNDDTLVQVREALLKYNVSEYEVLGALWCSLAFLH